MTKKIRSSEAKASCAKAGLYCGGSKASKIRKSLGFILIELLATAILAAIMAVSCIRLN